MSDNDKNLEPAEEPPADCPAVAGPPIRWPISAERLARAKEAEQRVKDYEAHKRRFNTNHVRKRR